MLKCSGTVSQDTVGYDILKIFEDLFLSQEQPDDMLLEGNQSKDLCEIYAGSGNKKPSGVDAEKKRDAIYGTKYYIRLDHEISSDHSIFYPQALYNELLFDVTPAEASQVVKGSTPSNLKCKLANIQLEYEMIRSKMLAEEVNSCMT